jgi:hypothetical protein
MARLPHHLFPRLHRLQRCVLHRPSERDDQRRKGNVEKGNIGRILDLSPLVEDGLEGCFAEIKDGKGGGLGEGLGREEVLPCPLGRLTGLLGRDGDDGEIVLGDACMGGDPGVCPLGRVGDGRLLEDGEGGDGVDGGDHLSLDDLVAGGGEGREEGAVLCMAKLVRVPTGAGIVRAGTERPLVEGRCNVPVGEVEGFGRGNGRERESAEKGRVLNKRLLLEGGKGGEEGGVSSFEDLSASGALAGERDGLVDKKELKKGSKEAISRLDRTSDQGTFVAVHVEGSMQTGGRRRSWPSGRRELAPSVSQRSQHPLHSDLL